MKTFNFGSGTVALPRFKLGTKYENDMAESLQACGMRNAFTSRADFGRISSDALQITECRQAVTLEVNEQGAEASSATEFGMGRGIPREEFSMVVNRPFVVAICSGDAILFIGAVTDPR
jgi:serine protease inhibitor